MALDKKDAAQKANFTNYAYAMFYRGGLRPDPLELDQAGYSLLYWLNAKDFDEAVFYGYIAVSKANPGEHILAIRGTQTLKEWLLDFLALPVPFRGVTGGGFVALGFLKIFRTFEFISRGTGASSSLNATIATLAPSIGSLLATGHSLGAALSSLTALALAVANPGGVKGKITSFTFASPRVGLLDFASSFHCNINKSFRVWNVLDIVPEFPTFPFIHVGGHGDALVQTAGQLETLRLTPPCEHHLTSYQWLLDADNFNLNAECDRSLEAGLESVGEDGASVGAEAMARAMGGRG